ncbi:MAG: 5-methyltetrahydropteroyltriglutamate--homocysteine S-methyltransferase [Alphaproteobacteria bacterium]|nr:5-methyltetrahydropteroyltriglutamate--homocysteine S-methyltransferase [Alphaproteobacteria bacterium]MBT5828243.1 5-methyltetrahydropteroyltriglutamate--homocysteine S-methyltransferase [Alphaproteobacteria bacterium]
MVHAANLGFPRIGLERQLKKSLENYWQGKIKQEELKITAKDLRKKNWELQKESGIKFIPSNDFSFYDHVLDLTAMVGAVPKRYNFSDDKVDLDLYFAMARGAQNEKNDVVAMEMTKWFDTNYHYIVPEFSKETKFKLASTKIIDEYLEAKKLGIETRPVLLGPVSFLLLGKSYDETKSLDLLEDLLVIYQEILAKLAECGVQWVQIDEPCLVTDLSSEAKFAYEVAYKKLRENFSAKIMLTSYFAELGENLALVKKLPIDGLHIDLVRGNDNVEEILANFSSEKFLSLGLIDGRNIWKNNFSKSLAVIDEVIKKHPSDKVLIAPSSSLLHCPLSLEVEDKLNSELKEWLAFASEKLTELNLLTKVANEGRAAYKLDLAENHLAIISRENSNLVHNYEVKEAVKNLTPADYKRDKVFAERIKEQQKLGLPLLPITTIGSFPQTKELRKIRADFKKKLISKEQYESYLAEKTTELIKWQEDIGIDVPVHGEYERNDMVEYFGEQLSGYAFTKNGWVQSYGSRCVKPPIIYGDVARAKAMTVYWSSFAQNLTDKPVKGMLTGPITMLQWAFVRDDQPRELTCKQIALAIRAEVKDLEESGIKIIQIDEPAFREGLPLRNKDRDTYLEWAVASFRLSSSNIKNDTQIHTHMCYSEFNDIIDEIAALDADVISIETSRSAMELLDAFIEFKYPNHIGPGVYDIHSPRVPKVEEMEFLVHKALESLDVQQIWINPDCGLKTRNWPEVKASLENMVIATKNLRSSLKKAA